MKNPFDGFITGLDMVEEIISKLEYIYIYIYNPKKEKKKKGRRTKVEN